MLGPSGDPVRALALVCSLGLAGVIFRVPCVSPVADRARDDAEGTGKTREDAPATQQQEGPTAAARSALDGGEAASQEPRVLVGAISREAAPVCVPGGTMLGEPLGGGLNAEEMSFASADDDEK